MTKQELRDLAAKANPQLITRVPKGRRTTTEPEIKLRMQGYKIIPADGPQPRFIAADYRNKGWWVDQFGKVTSRG